MEPPLLPRDLLHPEVTPLLDQIARDHARLVGRGGMKGILLVDQDAKVLAKNSMFQLKRPWDMGAIGAALHGVAKQASLYFNASAMERVSIIFGNMQFFIHNVGTVDTGAAGGGERELLLVILAEKDVKVGLVVVQMRRHAALIVDAVRRSAAAMGVLRLPEREVAHYLLGLQGDAGAGAQAGPGASR